jgi:hypothetical protein
MPHGGRAEGKLLQEHAAPIQQQPPQLDPLPPAPPAIEPAEPAVRRSARESKPVTEWWKLPKDRINLATVHREPIPPLLDPIPINYEESLAPFNRDAARWKPPRDAHMTLLKDLDVWHLVPLPKGRTALKGSWVPSVRRNEKGEITELRWRFVGRGYMQILGVNLDSPTYAPVIKGGTLRLFFALCAVLMYPEPHYCLMRRCTLNSLLDPDRSCTSSRRLCPANLHSPHHFSVSHHHRRQMSLPSLQPPKPNNSSFPLFGLTILALASHATLITNYSLNNSTPSFQSKFHL